MTKILCGCGREFSKAGLARHKCEEKPVTFSCTYCKAEFKKEETLFNHQCEQKRRHADIREKANIQGFRAYEYWYKQTYGQTKTYEDFCKSNLFTAFIRFGKFVLAAEIYNSLLYVDFLIKISAKIDDWNSEKLYNAYIIELNKNEEPFQALERSIKVMQQWSIRYGDGGDNWFEFFHKVETPLAALWISTGKISPWTIFLAPRESVKKLLERFSKEQSEMFNKAIDAKFWRAKIERANQTTIAEFREILKCMEI